MPQLRDPIIVPFEATVVDVTGEYFVTEPLSKRGEVWFIERVSAMNDDKQGTLVDVGVRHGTRDFWFRTVVLTNRDQWYAIPLRITLLTDYQVVLRFTNIDLGDHIYANVNAYVLEPFEQPGVAPFLGAESV